MSSVRFSPKTKHFVIFSPRTSVANRSRTDSCTKSPVLAGIQSALFGNTTVAAAESAGSMLGNAGAGSTPVPKADPTTPRPSPEVKCSDASCPQPARNSLDMSGSPPHRRIVAITCAICLILPRLVFSLLPPSHDIELKYLASWLPPPAQVSTTFLISS